MIAIYYKCSFTFVLQLKVLSLQKQNTIIYLYLYLQKQQDNEWYKIITIGTNRVELIKCFWGMSVQ